jgi:hypothetical protein
MVEHPAHPVLVSVMLSAALGACIVDQRIVAVLMLGAVGCHRSKAVRGAGRSDSPSRSLRSRRSPGYRAGAALPAPVVGTSAPLAGHPHAVSLVVGVGIFVFAIVSCQARSAWRVRDGRRHTEGPSR